MAKRTVESFIIESKVIHGESSYDYSLFKEYLNNKAKIPLICLTCNTTFNTTANDHLGKKQTGCAICSNKNKVKRTSRLTFTDFQTKANTLHNNLYNYVKTEDIYPYNLKVDIECPHHGTFSKTVYDHIREDKPAGCPKCSYENRQTSKEDLKALIDTCKTMYKNKYDYSLINLKTLNNINNKVSIICPVHGVFEQSFYCHFYIHNECNACSKSLTLEDIKTVVNSSVKYNKTDEVFYDFKDDIQLVNRLTLRNLYCKEHKLYFDKTYTAFKNNPKCPGCSCITSQYESDILSYVKELEPSIELIQSHRPSWMLGKELDIFIPKYNLAIEFNGSVFHHSSKSEFVSKFCKDTYKNPNYHYDKWKLCKDNGITLLSIYDFYWFIDDKQSIYKSKIKHYMQKDKKIFARKCFVKDISYEEAVTFYQDNHLEGSGFNYPSSNSVGLFFQDEMIMCASLINYYNQSSKLKELKLHRICTLQNFTVVGGISKLSKYLKNTYGEFKYYITLTTGGSTLNFYNIDTISLRYFWVNSKDPKEYYHRNYCQKNLLEKHFHQPLFEEDTENTYMERLGFLKIYDNGVAKLL